MDETTIQAGVNQEMSFFMNGYNEQLSDDLNIESSLKSRKPLNPLKETLKSSLIFNEFPFRGQG